MINPQCFTHSWSPWMVRSNETRVKTSEANWKKPLKWNREAMLDHASRLGPTLRPRVFSNSLCDVFEDWPGPIVNAKGYKLFREGDHVTSELPVGCGAEYQALTMSDLRRDMFGVIDETPNLDWLLLTKWPENTRRFWKMIRPPVLPDIDPGEWYRTNCWLLYSASDQPSLEAGIDHLLECRLVVPVLGLSLEPLLGPIEIDPWLCPVCEGRHWAYGICANCEGKSISWVRVGGESGPNARPCQIEWILDIVEQCDAAGVPCFVTQFGARAIGLSHPKGGDPTEWPEEFRVQQIPEVKHDQNIA